MKVVFLSDLHLGARYIRDKRRHEAAICRFLREECADADHVYMLGDMLDYWYEYREVVPKGNIRFFGALAALADSGVKITWLTGNHDIWMFGYLADELGIEIIDAPYIERTIAGKHFILAHGDRIGNSKLSFNIISKLFRSRFCQMLYGAIHPRWTVPFAHRWSSNSRYSHQLADDDEGRHRDYILQDAKKLIEQHPDANYLVMGHHHLMMNQLIPGTHCRVVVLGEWIELMSYAVFNGTNLELAKGEF